MIVVLINAIIGTTQEWNSKKSAEKLQDMIKMKTRVILVLLFIALFSVISYISLRGSYLEYKELSILFNDVLL